MPRTHVPVLAGELIEALDPQPGQVAVDCTLGGARPRAASSPSASAPPGTLIGDRPRPARRGARSPSWRPRSRADTRFIRADFAHGPRSSCARRASQADLVYLDLGMSSMQVDTRERGFSYAYDAPLDMRMDPDQELDRRRDRQHVGAPPARAHAARVRRGALRRPDRGRDRPPPRRSTHHLRARRRDHRRDPRARAVRRRPPGQAHLPGDPDRRQRRARPARRGAPARVGRCCARRPARRDLVPLARGPARQALPRRPGARLHLPARPARLRVRPHARGRARVPPLGRRRRPGEVADEPALEVGPPAGRPQAREER